MIERRTLGKYTLVAEIARGGVGVLYLAETSDPPSIPPASLRASRPAPAPHGRPLFVVKQLRPELLEDPKLHAMFLDEGRLATQLVHRNIVFTHEASEEGGRPYIVMEYLEGRTFDRALRLRGEHALPLPTILRIACSVLAGLHHAHDVTDQEGAPLGIVHRDVRAESVILTYDGQVKLLDFGAAMAFGRVRETEAGALIGHLSCMAPERLAEDVTLDRRADVFSVGVMLREALTRTRVWQGSDAETLKDLRARKIPSIPSDVDLAPELRAILDQAMAPEREQRFRTAHAMRAALEQYVIRIDPNGSVGKAAEILGRAFEGHRAHARRVIDEHFIPALRAPNLPVVPPSSLDVAAAQSASGPSTPDLASPMSDPEVHAESGSTAPEAVPSRARAASLPKLETEPPAGVTGRDSIAPPRRLNAERTSRLLLGGVALVALAATGASFGVYRRDPTSSSTATAHASPSGSSGAPVGEETVDLGIRAEPEGAQILVDDRVVDQNPWRAKLPRGSAHSVRVVAKDHAPKLLHVVLERPSELDVVLERIVPSSARTSAIVSAPASGVPVVAGPAIRRADVEVAAPASAATTPSPSDPAPTVFGGGKAPTRSIDPKSPYD